MKISVEEVKKAYEVTKFIPVSQDYIYVRANGNICSCPLTTLYFYNNFDKSTPERIEWDYVTVALDYSICLKVRIWAVEKYGVEFILGFVNSVDHMDMSEERHVSNDYTKGLKNGKLIQEALNL